MSDTRRELYNAPDMEWLQDVFERTGLAKFKPPESLKHWHKDRQSWSSKCSKNHRYSKHLRNTKYNLVLKNEQLSLREHLNLN